MQRTLALRRRTFASVELFPHIIVLRRWHPQSGPTEEAPAAMYSIFYIIGVVVVILAVLSLLGLA
jgi:hypothetical protein